MFYDEDPPFTERTRLMAYQPAVLVREIERLRAALGDILSAQPMWHGGVGPVPREFWQALVESIRDTAREALRDTGADQTRVGHDSPDR